MKKNIFIIPSFLLAACSSPTNNETSLTIKSISMPSSTNLPTPRAINYKDSLLGNWSDGSDENATIQIQDDSVLYISHLDKYKYTIQNDSIKIFFPNNISASKIIFNGDTLWWISINDTTKLWKFK